MHREGGLRHFRGADRQGKYPQYRHSGREGRSSGREGREGRDPGREHRFGRKHGEKRSGYHIRCCTHGWQPRVAKKILCRSPYLRYHFLSNCRLNLISRRQIDLHWRRQGIFAVQTSCCDQRLVA